MKIKTVEFVGTVADPGQPTPGDLPQVAFSGRSNVGKSSLINTVLGRTRKGVARVSGTPGKTQALNFYRVNDEFMLVDLPGYGFARVPKKVQEKWKALVEGYLSGDTRPRGVVHLVDARHPPTPLDHQMVEYLAAVELPTLVVLTKMDKLKRSQRKKAVDGAHRDLRLDPEQILPFSSKTGEGKDTLLAALSGLLAATGEET